MRRNTIQRSIILDAAQRMDTHPTADEMYAAVSQTHPSISRATVYRNLKLLVEEGALIDIAIPDGATRFDHTYTQHYHAKCTKCGHVFDVDMDYIPHLENEIRDTHGFRFSGYDLVFKGVCSDCQNP